MNIKQLANLPLQEENNLLPLAKNEGTPNDQKGFAKTEKRVSKKEEIVLIDRLSFSSLNSTELNITNINNSFPVLNNSDFSQIEKNNESSFDNITTENK